MVTLYLINLVSQSPLLLLEQLYLILQTRLGLPSLLHLLLLLLQLILRLLPSNPLLLLLRLQFLPGSSRLLSGDGGSAAESGIAAAGTP